MRLNKTPHHAASPEGGKRSSDVGSGGSERRSPKKPGTPRESLCDMANLRTKILDFRGFDSSIISILRGGVLMSIGEFPESLSQAILAGIISVGRLGDSV